MYRFEWEREWRHVRDLNFTVQDVAFLIIPENLHQNARIFLKMHCKKIRVQHISVHIYMPGGIKIE
jgi:hypothetical protein